MTCERCESKNVSVRENEGACIDCGYISTAGEITPDIAQMLKEFDSIYSGGWGSRLGGIIL